MDYVHFSLERVEGRVVLAARDDRGRNRLTLDVHRRGMASLAASARMAAESDEDTELDLTLRGTLRVEAEDK